jgi:hypothetical protein
VQDGGRGLALADTLDRWRREAELHHGIYLVGRFGFTVVVEALRLARVTAMSADFWLGSQQDWDLWHALRSTDPIIEALEPLPRVG